MVWVGLGGLVVVDLHGLVVQVVVSIGWFVDGEGGCMM